MSIIDYKDIILNFLTLLKNKEDNNNFQIRAYDKVIKNIKDVKDPIVSFCQVENIDGVGKSIKLKLKEIIETGSLKELKSTNDIMSELLQIYGVGPKKARELIEIHHISSIEDLRNKIKDNCKLLTYSQEIGLKCYEDFLERIPREEIYEHQKLLSLNKDKGEIVGSFRRNEKTSGDIDIMLNMDVDEFNIYINKLIDKNYLKFILARGDKKLLGVCAIKNSKNRRIDLIRNTTEEYPYMKLYFTGPKEFNVVFRQHCLDIGLSLNEHSFTPEVKGLKTEKDIFNYVGLKYVDPENRNAYCLQKK